MFLSKREFYFAYGSNMSSKRLIERISSAKVLGTARLDDYIWCCNKLGRDGTAKANIMRQDAAAVYGVLFSIKAKHCKPLDQIENGYRRIEVELDFDGEKKSAFTYQSELITNHPPTESYVSFIIDGLIEHRFPEAYVREIRREAGI
ncbi:AIG2-like family protein [Mariprofundus micogutta]|uniref:AIG2-like family protein n=1 Tax=Mariprofundus micogutta TaxID=1921010 RepID=A0A1L8CMQ6_9PROT|nr:gamma-glutamylcyclotransferase family protein [Mariprofundus micogutta]GAV20192.1 AIG2-like family protein [Mariprofundus micogutta]